jgi:hypothetical protein
VGAPILRVALSERSRVLDELRFVEGDAEGLYYLFIERRLDGVSISGNRALLDRLIEAAPQPIVA